MKIVVLFLLSFIVIGKAIQMLGQVFLWWLYLRSAHRWDTARGHIIESFQYRDPDQNDMLTFWVKYQFETYSGVEVIGTTPRACGKWFWSSRAEAEFVARYSPGDEADVYYDPVSPGRNCLDREDRSSFLAQACASALTAFCGGLGILGTSWAMGLLNRDD